MPLLALLLTVALAPSQDFLSANMDRSVDPGVDFFSYANGTWLKNHPIPSSESGWGIGNAVDDDLYLRLKAIDEKAISTKAKQGDDLQRIGDFWATAMDEHKAERLGTSPLNPELSRIQAIRSVQDAIDESFSLNRIGVSTFFDIGIGQDDRDSDTMVIKLGQGGLGLPNRDFYFNPEPGVAKIRVAYAKHIEKVLAFSGLSDSGSAAKDVLAFETALAKISRRLADLRDPIRNYNKMQTAAIEQDLTPSIHWGQLLGTWNVHPDSIIVGQPEFFSGLDALLKGTPVSTLKSYLRYHVVSRALPFLNKAADELNFEFGGKILSGQKTQRPRWKRVIDSENRAIGFVLGRAFVKEFFDDNAKRRYANLVEAFRTAFGERIDRLDWMSPETKAKAHEKLAVLHKKVGFPDKWKDYSKLVVGRESYFQNMVNASKWRFDDELAKYGKPVDRTEWGMTPQTYNAYYDSSNNEIVLPAAAFAIPGMRDSQLDDAVIYGYAGASTIGHEMTHGFDDDGRQYDAKGNLKEWWTPEDAANFKARAAVMVKEFSGFEPIKGLHINGEASLGENIADYGGLLIGIDAFKKTKQYKEGKKIGGLTPMQRYFLAYSLSWMDQEREQRLRSQLLSDVHAPAKWRVIGPLSNIPEFFEAFGIKPGQPMRRPENLWVHIW